LFLWATFIFVQTVRHRDYFLPVDSRADQGNHQPRPSARSTAASFGVLLVALVAVVGLAEAVSPNVEAVVTASAHRQPSSALPLRS
jgi:Ca2+:H+ antiporter